MKIIDKTPFQNENGEFTLLQRVQGTIQHGLQWFPELEAQKTVMTQLEQVLEKGFTLIRNFTLTNSQIVEPLILIGPPGVFVISVTPLSGFYEAKGDQWNVVNGGRSSPAPINLLYRVGRLARALQVYLNRQGVVLPSVVEPVLIASSPAMHIESLRPIARVVMSDAIRQFAASLLQGRPMLRPEQVYDIADRIITPRPKETAPQPEPAVEAAPAAESTPAAQPQTPTRARAIFHAADEAKPFDPADLSFAFDENAESEVPAELRETSPSQRLPRVSGKRGAFSARQWIMLGGMLLVECCVLAGFGYLILIRSR
jgi:hypothetical protein